MDNINKRKLIIKAYRDIAVIAFIAMFAHVILLVSGIHLSVARYTFALPIPVGIAAIALSSLLHYCLVHRLCLVYTTVVSACIVLQEELMMFGRHLTTARTIMLVIGFIILIRIIRTYKLNVWVTQ